MKVPYSAKHSRINNDNSLTHLNSENRKDMGHTQVIKEQEKLLKCLVVPTQMVEGLSGTMGMISSGHQKKGMETVEEFDSA